MANIVTSTAAKLHISPTLGINELVLKTRAEGKHVVHLGFGEATFPIQKDVLQIHKDGSNTASYMPVAGTQDLRKVCDSISAALREYIRLTRIKAIADFNAERLGVSISPEQVVVAPGSKPLLFALFDILQGDVLLPRPSWVSYEQQVLHAGKKLFWLETDPHDRHSITGTLA